MHESNDNIFPIFTNNLNYFGFTNGAEKTINQEPAEIGEHTLNVGDRIVGFSSGKKRSSFLLSYDYMTYMGKQGPFLLFDVTDSKTPVETSLFQERPVWYLAFAWFPDRFRLHMYSTPATSWDIDPKEIIYYTEKKSRQIIQQ